MNFRDHAVVIPTSRGGVSAVVSEPVGPQLGAIVLLQGAGAPCRAGVNGWLTRLARELAALGLVTLRYDFACEGDNSMIGREVERDRGWRRSVDLAVLREIAPWFMRRTAAGSLFAAGSCHGARVAFEFAATEPAVKGTFLLVPYLDDREPHLRAPVAGARVEIPPLLDQRRWGTGPTLNGEAELLTGFRACLSRGPVWILCGHDEAETLAPYRSALRDEPRALEVEVIADMAELHPVAAPVQQERATGRLLGRVSSALRGSTEAALS